MQHASILRAAVLAGFSGATDVPDLAGAAFVNVPIYFALILTVVSGADCPTLNRDCLRDI